MTRLWAKAVWVAAVAASWSLIAVGAVDNFFIEGTSSALAQARVGQHRAAAGALLLLSLGMAVPLMRPRFRRTATGLVAGRLDDLPSCDELVQRIVVQCRERLLALGVPAPTLRAVS